MQVPNMVSYSFTPPFDIADGNPGPSLAEKTLSRSSLWGLQSDDSAIFAVPIEA